MFKALDRKVLFGGDPNKQEYLRIDSMELYEIGLRKI